MALMASLLTGADASPSILTLLMSGLVALGSSFSDLPPPHAARRTIAVTAVHSLKFMPET